MLSTGIRKLSLSSMKFVRFKGMPIIHQLQVEEQLLRTSLDNWCIINDGTNAPAVVMGLSGRPANLLDVDSVLRDKIPVIRRFTGGGTVIVDHDTVFVTLICNKDAIPGLQPYPSSIMSWSSLLYDDVFNGVGDFQLRENDYVFGDRKFGGNAQSITRTRWIHHTSFLWDYEAKYMAYLKLPARAPSYRSERGHMEFLCPLKHYMPRLVFIDKTIMALNNHFSVEAANLDVDAAFNEDVKFPRTTKLLSKQELTTACWSR